MATPERNLTVVQHQAVSMPQEKIELIRNTVAKGASNNELEMFLHLAGRYNLDPFAKEIWCIKRQKKDSQGKYIEDPNTPAVIMTSRDGYLKIAQSDPNFDGIKSFVVKEGDHFEIDAQSDQVIHKFGAKRGKILGAWAICHHKQRKPSMCFVDFAEYNANSTVWQKYPSAMIQKVAEVFVLKRQFNINGLVTQEEMDSSFEPAPMMDVTPAIEKPKSRAESEKHKSEIILALKELGEYATSLGVDPKSLRNMKPDKHVTKWDLADIEEVKQMVTESFAVQEQAAASEIVTEEDMDGMQF